ncbi:MULTISPECIES: DUF368 domain-containing protein [Sellimonas]|uniref:DUF368 domain-containing protein n=1 Tax=Sellimonas caecigallum TaxID=2592333 RepID=A0ABS7L3Y2_9FIRM|nr:DUF368 domain-containing protein [Sellimonas caecigallum]OUP64129.1 DUF368 domain-containing protein [Drancourtella sp. An177]
MIMNFIRGFCMALADSVPGVSGGTIAFLLGFYDKFIDSLDHIMGKDKKKRKEAILFLCKIAGGWIIGMAGSVLVLASLFEKHIYQISSMFLGLILFSIPLIISEEKKTIKGNYRHLFFLVIGVALVVVISCLNPVAGEGISVDAGSLNIGLGAYVFIAGMIAICAMVLPGISGSTILLVFGLYIPIITSLKEILHLNMEYLPVLIIFGLGVLTGIALVIRAIKTSLKKYRSQMIYLIIGMMIGSLYAIKVGPTTLEAPRDQLTLSTFSIVFFIIGAILVLGLQKLQMVGEEK